MLTPMNIIAMLFVLLHRVWKFPYSEFFVIKFTKNEILVRFFFQLTSKRMFHKLHRDSGKFHLSWKSVSHTSQSRATNNEFAFLDFLQRTLRISPPKHLKPRRNRRCATYDGFLSSIPFIRWQNSSRESSPFRFFPCQQLTTGNRPKRNPPILRTYSLSRNPLLEIQAFAT